MNNNNLTFHVSYSKCLTWDIRSDKTEELSSYTETPFRCFHVSQSTAVHIWKVKIEDESELNPGS